MLRPTSKASMSVWRIRSLPLPRSRSCEHHLQAADEVLALLVDRRLEHLGVQREEVRRVHRLDEVAGVEGRLAALLRVHVADRADGVLQEARGQQVGLLEVVEDRVLRPFLVAKRLSAFIMCGSCRSCTASLAPIHFSIEFCQSCCCAAQNSMVLSATCLRVVPHRAVELGEGRPGVQRVGVPRAALLHLRGQEPLPDLARDIEDLGHVVGHVLALLGQRSAVLAVTHRVTPPCGRTALAAPRPGGY